MPDYIGRYRAERVVGSGAFATVWLAHDETLAAPVAIKVLADNWAHDPQIRERFVEEARILWRADSDHIVRIHNVDQLADGRPYFVMDYADRGTLQERMLQRAEAGQRWSVDEAVEHSLAIADGLKVAHALDIVHRDLKPANIMFQSVPAHHGDRRDEKLILTDFGMAKSLARSRGTTIATGTPFYMAPEQAEGRADARSDIYGAAVVLYELLSGRVPYQYDSPGRLLNAQYTERPEPIVNLRADLPHELAEAIETGLATDPEHRWPTADAWAGALAAAAGGRPAAGLIPGVPSDALHTVGPEAFAAARAGVPGAGATPPPGEGGPLPPSPPPGGPPTPPPGGPPTPPPGGTGGHGRRRRWWRIAVPALAALLLLGGVVGVIVATGGGEGDAPEVTELLLEPVASVGRDPFTESVVPQPGAVGASAVPTGLELPQELVDRFGGQVDQGAMGQLVNDVVSGLSPLLGAAPNLRLGDLDLPPAPPGRITAVAGSAPGLYGGTQLINVCDKQQLVRFLRENLDKARAWATVHGIAPGEIPQFVNGLTDVVLQADTRVTNHGFTNGRPFPIDSVLQAGTAVLVDTFGVPQVRCYCGNPLRAARPLTTKEPKLSGTRWPGFSLPKTVVIKKAKKVPEFAVDDVLTDNSFVFRRPGTPLRRATLRPTVTPPGAPPTTPTTTPTPPGGGQVTLEHVGTADKVGSGPQATPDGAEDAHFAVTVVGSGTVTDILLQTADDQGNPCCGQFWNTTPDNHWILGVERDGRRLNPTDQAISDPVGGSARYDLFANTSGYFKPGQKFVVTVTFSDGTRSIGLVTYGQGAAQPPPRPASTNITSQGNVNAESEFPTGEFPARLSVDGNPATSWFSAGSNRDGTSTVFAWGPRDQSQRFIETVRIVSNAGHPRFPTGFGFGSVTIEVVRGGTTVFSRTVSLPGTPDPNVTVSPKVAGDVVRLVFSGHEDPTCGGFAELVVIGGPA